MGFLAVYSLLSGLTACGSDKLQSTWQAYQTNKSVPDTSTRNQVKNIQVSDVKKLRFYGDFTGYSRTDPLDVSDAALIEQFLDALKQAVSRGVESQSRTSVLAIVLNEKPGQPARSEHFSFKVYPRTSLEAYGEAFMEALRALGRYQVNRLHELTQETKAQVQSAEISVHGTVRSVTNPQEVQAFLAELEAADDSVFAYAEPGVEARAKLFLRDGRVIPLHFVLRSYASNQKEEAKAPDKMPQALWQAYKEFARRR